MFRVLSVLGLSVALLGVLSRPIDSDVEEDETPSDPMDLEYVPWGSQALPQKATTFTPAKGLQKFVSVGGMYWPGIDPVIVQELMTPELKTWLDSNGYKEYWNFPDVDYSKDVDHNVNTKDTTCGLVCTSSESQSCIECPEGSARVVVAGKVRCLGCPPPSVLSSEGKCLKSHTTTLTYEVRCPRDLRPETRESGVVCIGGSGGPTQIYGQHFYDPTRTDLCRFDRMSSNGTLTATSSADWKWMNGLELLRLKRYSLGSTSEQYYDDFSEDITFQLKCLTGDQIDRMLPLSGYKSLYEGVACKRTVHLPIALEPEDVTARALCPKDFVKSAVSATGEFSCFYPYKVCPKLYMLRFQCAPNNAELAQASGAVMLRLFGKMIEDGGFTQFDKLCIELKQLANKMQCISFLNMIKEHHRINSSERDQKLSSGSLVKMHGLVQKNQFLPSGEGYKFLPGGVTIKTGKTSFTLESPKGVTGEKQSPGRVCVLGGFYGLESFKLCLGMAEPANYPFITPSENWGAYCASNQAFVNKPLTESYCELLESDVTAGNQKGGKVGDMCGVSAS